MTRRKSIALVHDWLFGMRGGERCLQAFMCLYQDAHIFSLFHEAGRTDQEIDQKFVEASLLNRLPNKRKLYRALLPLFPFFSYLPSLKNYSVRISTSHAASKNIKGSPADATHICYCFTPMRYIWDQASRYLGWKSFLFFPLINFLRIWDKAGARSVTDFIAISKFVAARVRKYYKRNAKVIFPPVATRWLEVAMKPQGLMEKDTAYLFAGALVPYKGAELAVKACLELDKELWVAGDGPLLEKLQALGGSKVKFFGKVSDAELAYLMKSSRALIFPCKEDFGILPLEVQSVGRPVIALFAGACKETILGYRPWQKGTKSQDLASPSYTGVFIKRTEDSQQLNEVKKAILEFEKIEGQINPEVCRAQAHKFSPESFYESWNSFVQGSEGLRSLPMANKIDFVNKFEGLRIGSR